MLLLTLDYDIYHHGSYISCNSAGFSLNPKHGSKEHNGRADITTSNVLMMP